MRSFGSLTIREWMERLAEKSATPGGGSAAALAGAMAAALNSMVIRFTLPKANAYRKAQLRILLRRSEALRRRLVVLADRDSQAFEAVRRASKKKRGVQKAMVGAAAVPLESAEAAWECLSMASALVRWGNPYLVSDAAAAGLLAYAAVQAAAANVLINARSLKGRRVAQRFVRPTRRLIRQSQDFTIRLLHDSRARLER